MMLKFDTPAIAARDLTVKITGLLPRETEFYIKFSFKAGGNGNPAFVAGLERIRHADFVAERVIGRIEDDAEHATMMIEQTEARGKLWFGMIYDACITGWETNILSDGKPIEPTRENFIELSQQVWPKSIPQAMVALQRAIMLAGADDDAADKATVKN